MNVGMRLGSLVLGITFIFSLLASAWDGAPEFIQFVANNRAFFMGIGAGVIASSFIRRPLALIAVVVVVFIVLRALGV